jgi:hypothetical protein
MVSFLAMICLVDCDRAWKAVAVARRMADQSGDLDRSAVLIFCFQQVDLSSRLLVTEPDPIVGASLANVDSRLGLGRKGGSHARSVFLPSLTG